ncbi:MAG: carboxypeptidase regulatory-like domain-containing protein, partial [Acidobacteriota bacterium]
MIKTIVRLLCLAVLSLACAAFAYGQGSTNSSLTGVIVDQSGAVIPGAEIVAKDTATNEEFRAISAENGTFSIAVLRAGTYTVTVTAPSFKQSVLKDVKIVAATPATIHVTLQVGGTNEVITVEAGAEIVQSQSATITTTLEVKQISQLPLQARNVIYYLMQLPGVSSAATASPRNSTVNGMPSTAYNITIDGLNSQDNLLKDSDGFFSYIYPTMDAIQEVTLSTATPGAESGGQGAIQIKFVTRSGSNEYHGSLYEYHRNPVFNSDYWFNNRDQSAVQDAFPHAKCGVGGVPYDLSSCHAPRDRVLFNQVGGRAGGPISIPGLFNGKDKAFFFVNVEAFLLPNQIARARTLLNPLTQAGTFQYTVTGQTAPRTVNLLTLAAANGQPATIDPTVGKLLADIQNSTSSLGGVVQSSNPNLQTFTFANYGIQKRYYPTVRFDFNLTPKLRLENTWNYQSFYSVPDGLNSVDSAFPGFPNMGGQNSNRFGDSVTLRSTLTPRLVNEARAGLTGGTVLFSAGVDAGQFTNTPIANQAGFSLGIGAAGITSATSSTSIERRNTPIKDIADTMSWSHGAHNLSFGVQFTQVNGWIVDQPVVPTISFGIASGDPAAGMFTAANFPGASSTNLSDAQNIYAVLTGHVTAVNATAYLNENTNQYTYLGPETRRSRMREWGIFASDSWRTSPNLTLNYGLRWELQRPFTTQNGVYSTVSATDMWGVSGPGNMFKPGTLSYSNLTGNTYHIPVYTQWQSGSAAYQPSWHDFAPSFGFAWSPHGHGGLLERILGSSGQTVIRAGYSIAYNRPGTNQILTMFDSNPGLYTNATKSTTLGNLVSGTGTDVLPVLFSQTSRLGAPSF